MVWFHHKIEVHRAYDRKYICFASLVTEVQLEQVLMNIETDTHDGSCDPHFLSAHWKFNFSIINYEY